MFIVCTAPVKMVPVGYLFSNGRFTNTPKRQVFPPKKLGQIGPYYPEDPWKNGIFTYIYHQIQPNVGTVNITYGF